MRLPNPVSPHVERFGAGTDVNNGSLDGPVVPIGQHGRLRAWGHRLLRIAVSGSLLGLVIVRMDASQFGVLVTRADWAWWTAGLALVILATVASAQRLRLLIGGLGHRVSLGSVAAVNLEAIFFSLVIPGELLAGVVRWDRFSRHIGSRAGAFTVVAAERLIDWVVSALMAAAGAGLLFAGESAPRLRALTAAIATTVAVLGGGAVLAGRSPSFGRAVEAWMKYCGPRTRAWVERLRRILGAGRTLAADPRRTLAVFMWTAAYWGIALAGSVMMARAVFPQMPVLPFVAATAAVALLAQVPLTVAGMGLRELSLPVLVGSYGVTREVGLVVGFSAFVPYALLGAAGFVLRLVGRTGLAEEAAAPR